MPRDSVKQTFLVAVLLCLVCSLLVSASAVGLRSLQEANKQREKQKNIQIAAGNTDEEEAEEFETKILNLDTGEFLSDEEIQQTLGVKDAKEYDQKKAIGDPKLSDAVNPSEDIAAIKRREKYAAVYLVKEGETIKKIVLPIRGYGLWSTLWGFVAIDAESLKQGPEHLQIVGLKYYDQKETPGLGGEVDNPSWLAQWPGKHIYDANWNVKVDVTKSGADSEFAVDAISGATITSNGVTNMMEYWFGKNGYLPFLKNLSQK